MTKVAIDARWMTGNIRGMGRYARQLIRPIRDNVVGFGNAGMLPQTDYPIIAVGRSFYPVWEQRTLPRLVQNEKLNMLVCPYNTGPLACPKGVKLILVVHDLIFMHSWAELPRSVSLYQTAGRIYRRYVVPKVVSKAHHIVTVSEYTRSQLIDVLGVAPEKISVIPNALADDWFGQEVLPIAARENFFLTVTGESPSKNFPRLLKGFAAFCKERANDPVRLKVVGISRKHRKSFQEQCKRMEIINRVEFLDFISDEELRSFYRHARAFIFASLYEGFGIPLIEAMAAGAPIACSNTTSLPEVVGDAALLFDPQSVSSITSSLARLADDVELCEQLSAVGVQRAHRFSLRVVESDFARFWEKVLNV